MQSVHLLDPYSIRVNDEFEVVQMVQMRLDLLEEIIKVILQRRGRCNKDGDAEYGALMEGFLRVNLLIVE